MTQKDKELLLKDISARLPYDIIVEYGCKHEGKDLGEKKGKLTGRMIDSYFKGIQIGMSAVYSLKPYLRPMSSITDDEKEEYINLFEGMPFCPDPVSLLDWLNAHHIDYHGLIERGLAIEAPEGMY